VDSRHLNALYLKCEKRGMGKIGQKKVWMAKVVEERRQFRGM
jgi:hypothetical protein